MSVTHKPTRPGDPLTPRQRQVLAYLAEHAGRHQCFPQVREVCRVFGFTSPNAVRCHYQALANRSLVELSPKGFRVLRLVGATWTLTCDDSEAGRRLREALGDAPLREVG